MTGWQDSRSIGRRHEHTTVRNPQGQDICTSCWQQVVKPIYSSDDPRLNESGFMRSPHHEEERLAQLPHNLPMFMFVSYDVVLPYALMVVDFEETRAEVVEPDSLFEFLHDKAC